MATPGELDLGALRDWGRVAARVSAGPAPAAAHRPAWRAALALAARTALLAVLPFFVLIRASVLLYSRYHWHTWAALAGGAALTLVVVALYASWLSRRLTGRFRFRLVVRRVALPLVLAYCVYCLVYVSSLNAKSEGVRGYYTSLHPLLRMALATWILVDKDIVITDLARRPEDYAAMRLRSNGASQHYRQADGYVHAADLRTAGRGGVKSRLVQAYFWVTGFDTLRHVGTADHLHVELVMRE